MRSFFFVFVLLVLGLAYYYIGQRLITPAPFNKTIKRLLWFKLAFVPLLLPVSFLLRTRISNSLLTDLVGWSAYILMGFFSLLLVLLVLRDIYSLIQRFFRKSVKGFQAAPEYNPQRRQFIINSTNLAALGASFLLTGYGIYEARRQAKLEQVTIPIKNLPPEFDGFRIAQFSDMHVGPTIKRHFVESVVRQINDLNPDMIACTGDMIDGTIYDLRDDVAPLKELYAPHGSFFVTGNHEYYVNALPWIEELDRLGLRVLLNGHQLIHKSAAKIAIAGVTDYTSARFIPGHKSDPHRAVEGLSAEIPKILLAHQPKSIFEASEAGIDLQISGHTHAGQYLPWSFLVTLAQPYIEGLNRHQQSWIYVNRGTGYWGPPMRLGIPSEVTLITITSA